jgi:hypothetical protein
MPERRNYSILFLFALLVLLVTPSFAAEVVVPDLYNGQVDGTPVYAEEPTDGRIWSAWAYRSGAEFDLVVSVRDRRGRWSEAVFLGRDDGLNQVEPALVADRNGNLYLAWTEQPTGRVLASALRAGEVSWSEPIQLNETGVSGSAPALEIVRGRMAVAWRTELGTKIRVLPLADDALWQSKSSIVDGPDPISTKTIAKTR